MRHFHPNLPDTQLSSMLHAIDSTANLSSTNETLQDMYEHGEQILGTLIRNPEGWMFNKAFDNDVNSQESEGFQPISLEERFIFTSRMIQQTDGLYIL